MNRREFLKRALSLAPAAIALPSAVTYFLPPPGGWRRFSAFEYLDVEAIIKKALAADAVVAMDRLAWKQFQAFDRLQPGDRYVQVGGRTYVPRELAMREGLVHLNGIVDAWAGIA